MMNKALFGVVGLVAVSLFMNDLAGLAGLQQGVLDTTKQTPGPTASAYLITWWDVVRTIVVLVLVLALSFRTWRSQEAKIYKEELDAHKRKCDRLQEENLSLSKENGNLRGRTDLTQLLEAKMKYHAELVTALASLSSTLETRHKEGVRMFEEKVGELDKHVTRLYSLLEGKENRSEKDDSATNPEHRRRDRDRR
jgi:regulator of replication initiation timing